MFSFTEKDKLNDLNGIIDKIDKIKKRHTSSSSYSLDMKKKKGNAKTSTLLRATKEPRKNSLASSKEFVTSVPKAPRHLTERGKEDKLVHFYQSLALADSTKRANLRGRQQFTICCGKNGKNSSIPISEADRFQYIASVAAKTSSWPQVNLALQAIKYQYRILQIEFPSPSKAEKTFLKASRDPLETVTKEYMLCLRRKPLLWRKSTYQTTGRS